MWHRCVISEEMLHNRRTLTDKGNQTLNKDLNKTVQMKKTIFYPLFLAEILTPVNHWIVQARTSGDPPVQLLPAK